MAGQRGQGRPVLVTDNAPSGVAYSPAGKTLARRPERPALDAARRTLLATRPLPGGTITNAITYSPDGRLVAIARSDGTGWLLAVGSADKTVRLWNVRNPAHPALVGAPLTGPTSYVWAAAFIPTAPRSPSASPTAPCGCGVSPIRPIRP